jgi:hypothetical protein
MNNVEAIVYLVLGGSYTRFFSNVFELDRYFEDNQHIVKSIVSQ